MSEQFFQFKRFAVRQDRCAMKVGTDGVLLGAWVDPGQARQILDIGTGTGLIALMLAQRSSASIEAIEIDEQAFGQACDNVKQSPWSDRIKVMHTSLQDFRPGHRYDLIVSNPPYFIDSFPASDQARNFARQASTSLSFGELLHGVVRLLHVTGRFCVILPFREARLFRESAEQSGLFCNIMVNVRTGSGKPCKRVMMEFSRMEHELMEYELVLHEKEREFTPEYRKLTGDYYLHF